MDFFKPFLRVTISPSLKTYKVTAYVLVPNGCYSNAGVVPQAPKGHVHIPETQPLTLNIKHHDGICTDGIKVLTFTIAHLPLSEGITSVTAFAMVDDKVTGISSSPILQAGTDKSHIAELTSTMPPSGVIIQSVNGWINAMPGSDGPTMIVLVNVYAPCSNYDFEFQDLGPFGFTGSTLLLKLTATLPGACLRGIFDGPIRFDKKLASAKEFDSVAVVFENELYFDPLEIAR